MTSPARPASKPIPATLIGAIAIVLWSTLAVLTTSTARGRLIAVQSGTATD